MKKLILSLILSLGLAVSAIAQDFYFGPNSYGVWQSTGNACSGCGNSWITVTHSDYVNNYGYYEYYVWASTNSFTSNGVACYSYITNINIQYKSYGAWYIPNGFTKFWMIVGQKQVIYTLYYNRPDATVYIGIGNIQPYY